MTYDPTKYHAVVIEEDGFVINEESIKERFEEFGEEDALNEIREIMVVTGTAVPVPQSSDSNEVFYRASSHWTVLDQVYVRDEFWDLSEFKDVLNQANLIADALNAFQESKTT